MSLDALRPRVADRIKVCPESGCWLWQGELNRNGYGRVWIDGKRLMVHRVVYELLVDQIAEGLVLDHLCRNRPCCNPEHLDPVTTKENVHRGEAVLFQTKGEDD